MKIFRNYFFTWWQVGLLKAALLILGILIGTYFAPVVLQYATLLAVLFIVIMIYFLYVWVTDGFKGSMMT